MGFWHRWSFESAYPAPLWDRLKTDAQILLDALDHHPWREPDDKEAPLAPGYGKSIFGTCLYDEAIGFSPPESSRTACSPVQILNAPCEMGAKTGMLLYDQLLIGILCAAESHMPGNVRIDTTDGEPGYWQASADWSSLVLGRHLPLPTDIPGSHLRAALAEAHAISNSCRPSDSPAAPGLRI